MYNHYKWTCMIILPDNPTQTEDMIILVWEAKRSKLSTISWFFAFHLLVYLFLLTKDTVAMLAWLVKKNKLHFFAPPHFEFGHNSKQCHREMRASFASSTDWPWFSQLGLLNTSMHQLSDAWRRRTTCLLALVHINPTYWAFGLQSNIQLSLRPPK